MKKQHLDAEEKEIMEAIERDGFVPVTGVKLKHVADAIAAALFRRHRRHGE